MNRQELERVISNYTSQLESYSQRIPGVFEPEDIHKLRVTYKKLRAFIRMLRFEEAAGKLSIPATVKDLYGNAGAVRDIQLFLSGISPELKSILPDFISQRDQQLLTEKERLIDAIEEASFDKAEKKLSGRLPGKLSDAAIDKFIRTKVAAIRMILLTTVTEEELHGIRKQLKDIIYNIKTFEQEWGIGFPFTAWKSDKALNDTAEKLGVFNDHSIAARVWEKGLQEDISRPEKLIIEQQLEIWEQQKEIMIQDLTDHVRKLEVSWVFK